MGTIMQLRIETTRGTLKATIRIPQVLTKEEADREHEECSREMEAAEEFGAFARAHNFYTNFPPHARPRQALDR